MKVYALVGKSGTGKSFQATNLCRDNNIETIIDDGLFISGNMILAGISAKRQETKVGAIKTALFTKEEHRNGVIQKIAEIKPHSILVIGTSDKMVQQICDRLELPAPEKTIYIEDITTEEERAAARKSRDEREEHVIPAATFSIKKSLPGYFMDTLKRMIGRGDYVAEGDKTVVRPTYSYLGDYYIASRVIEDLIEHSAMDVDGVVSVNHIDIDNTPEGLYIHMDAAMRYGVSIPMVGRSLQQKIANRVYMMTAFNIMSVDIDVWTAR